MAEQSPKTRKTSNTERKEEGKMAEEEALSMAIQASMAEYIAKKDIRSHTNFDRTKVIWYLMEFLT